MALDNAIYLYDDWQSKLDWMLDVDILAIAAGVVVEFSFAYL
ncbi:hypothetical protein [Fischerella thermalis]|nr:hypothetical protein [Fischerella thermalis]